MIATQKHTYQVGEMLASSWGYGQTNVNFYVVVKTTATMIYVQEVESTKTATGNTYGTSMPTYSLASDTVWKRQVRDDAIMIASFERAYRWGGKPVHCSWGYFGCWQ